jgi:hypothetical protein
VLFTPLEFVEKLAALVPPTRWLRRVFPRHGAAWF